MKQVRFQRLSETVAGERRGDCPVVVQDSRTGDREGPTTESAEPVAWYGQVMSST